MQDNRIASSAQNAPSAGIDLQRLTARLTAIKDLNEFLVFCVRLINAAGGALFQSRPGEVAPVEELLSRQALSWSAHLRQDLTSSARTAMDSERIDYRCLETTAGGWIISCPLAADDGSHWCLTLLIVIGANPPEPFLVIAQLLAGHLASRPQLLAAGQPGANNCREALLDLLARALNHSGRREALLELTASLKTWSGSFQVGLGVVGPSGQVALRSLANVTSVDPHTDYARAIVDLMRESIDRRIPLAWSREETSSTVSPILRATATVTKADQCLAVPLGPPSREPVAALVFLWQECGDRGAMIHALHQTGNLLAAALTGPLSPALRLGALGGKAGAFAFRRSTQILLATGAIVLLSLIPLPFRINADCVTQPVSVRSIVARFDGILQEVVVAPGERVPEGKILARLEGKETELQLAGLTVERDKAAKMRDQYLATGETALAQIARLDTLRFEEQINLIQAKQQHLTLISPIAGVLLSGDLKRAEGSPVAKGQVLFEVSPLDSMEVELAVPERHVAMLRTGMLVKIRFTAYPNKLWQGTIEHLSPKSQIRGNANIFPARLRFGNPEGLLRPGMRGEAKISAGWRPIVWQLFRTPWHTLCRLGDRLF